MSDIEKIADISEKAIDRVGSVFDWIYRPKEEARVHLVELIKEDQKLMSQEKVALLYNSRKLAREYANSNTIYEQAKNLFNSTADEKEMDDDWLHFFFDKAEKVSSESMQLLWSKMLAGEFNKPESISRKLLHIISIMDVHSAKSFQTFCLYIFERKGLYTSYNTDAVMLPSGFYTDSFDFMRMVETWLCDAGYPSYKDLAIDLTMNAGELNSLENLGLVQRVSDSNCGLTLVYYLKCGKQVHLIPQDDNEFPLGQYSLTHEGQQLHQVINVVGNDAVLKISEQYLLSLGLKFSIEEYIGKNR